MSIRRVAKLKKRNEMVWEKNFSKVNDRPWIAGCTWASAAIPYLVKYDVVLKAGWIFRSNGTAFATFPSLLEAEKGTRQHKVKWIGLDKAEGIN